MAKQTPLFMDKRVPRWFQTKIKKIMEHNDYEFPKDITVKACEEKNNWTPVDLILREEYNNGSGSAKGFLGILPHENKKCYEWIKENQELMKELDYLSKTGVSNWGFVLWNNWKVH